MRLRVGPACRSRVIAAALLALSAVSPEARGQRLPGARAATSASSAQAGMRRRPLDLSPFQPRLDVPLSSTLPSSVALGTLGEAVFVTDDGVLAAVGPDGAVRWTLLVGPLHGAPALGPADVAYLASADQNLYAVDADGRLAWRQPLGGSPRGGATLLGDRVAVALDSGRVRTFAAAGGAPAGDWLLDAAPSAAPSAAAGRLAVPTVDGEVVVVGGAGAGFRASIDPGAPLAALAVDRAGAIYAGSAGGVLACLEADGRLRWRVSTGGGVLRSPALGGDGLLHVVAGTRLLALDAARGSIRSAVALGGTVRGGPLVGDDETVFVAVAVEAGRPGAPGVVLGVGPGGRRHLALPLPAAPMGGLTLADHFLWVGTTDLTLRRLRVPVAGLARSGWPKARGGVSNAGAVGPRP